MSLAIHDFDRTVNVINSGSKCGMKNKELVKSRMELILALGNSRRYETLGEEIAKLERNKRNWGELIYPLGILYSANAARQNVTTTRVIKDKMLKFYDYSRKNKQKIPLEGLDYIAEFKLPSS